MNQRVPSCRVRSGQVGSGRVLSRHVLSFLHETRACGLVRRLSGPRTIRPPDRF